jgi:peptidoglycan/LPS O-acetylase OafA/YrhL
VEFKKQQNYEVKASVTASSQEIPLVPKPNNFDLLRLICAFSVFIFHINSATDELKSINNLISLLSKSAVPMFFVISGFLIFMSYERAESIKEYFIKRGRRIYPAYLLVVVLCALLGMFFSNLPLHQYFLNRDFFEYLFYNLIFLNFAQPSLPGVFSDNLKQLVNPSLWTIRIEVMFYISVPILVFLLRKYNRLILCITLYLLSATFYQIMLLLYQSSGDMMFYNFAVKFLIGQLSYFISGALLYYHIDFFKKNAKWLLIIALPLYVISFFANLYFFQPISLAIIMFYLVFLTPHIDFFSRFGDLSYGIYIFHYPLIQVFYPSFKAHPYATFLLVSVVLILVSYACWHLVEKPFLAKKSHYRSQAG